MVKVNPGDPEIDKLSEEELAEYFYQHREDESIWEKKSYPVKPGRRGESTYFQMRIAGADLDEIARAAFASGGNVSEFVRSAALEKARALLGDAPPTTAEMLKKKLEEAQRLLDELQKQLPASNAQRVAERKVSYGKSGRTRKATNIP
jgi:uncharacterized protein (DUF1778 family)